MCLHGGNWGFANLLKSILGLIQRKGSRRRGYKITSGSGCNSCCLLPVLILQILLNILSFQRPSPKGKFLDTASTRLSGPVQKINFVCSADFITSKHVATTCSKSSVNSTCPLIHHPRMMPSQGLPCNSCLRALSVLGTSLGSILKPTLSNESAMLSAFSFSQSALMTFSTGTPVRCRAALTTRMDLRDELGLLPIVRDTWSVGAERMDNYCN